MVSRSRLDCPVVIGQVGFSICRSVEHTLSETEALYNCSDRYFTLIEQIVLNWTIELSDLLQRRDVPPRRSPNFRSCCSMASRRSFPACCCRNSPPNRVRKQDSQIQLLAEQNCRSHQAHRFPRKSIRQRLFALAVTSYRRTAYGAEFLEIRMVRFPADRYTDSRRQSRYANSRFVRPEDRTSIEAFLIQCTSVSAGT